MPRTDAIKLFWNIARPVAGLGQHPVADDIRGGGYFFRFDHLIRLPAVACEVSKLEVCNIRRVSALIHRDDMVNRRGKGVRPFQGLIHGFPTDAAVFLRKQDDAPVLIKLCFVNALTVRAVWSCHNLLHATKPPGEVNRTAMSAGGKMKKVKINEQAASDLRDGPVGYGKSGMLARGSSPETSA